MLTRLISLLKKDIKTGYRNYFFYVVIFIALLFAGIIQFAIPEDASIKPMVYYNVDYNGEAEDTILKAISNSKANHNKLEEVSSYQEVVDKMKGNFNSIGMVIKKENNIPIIEFIMQGHENDKIINTLILSMRDDLNSSAGNSAEVKSLILKQEASSEQIPLNKSVLPLFILMEPTMLGFFMIVALIFMEKDEGTIKAYKVSPGKVAEYLASKITLMIILGLISALISTFLVVGFEFDYLSLVLLVILGSIFSSSLGLITASFFDNLSQSVLWVILINILMGLPFVSYFVPSFAPIYIKLLPTYPLLFGIREALFPTGNPEIIYTTLITFVALSIVSYLLAIKAYNKNLARN